MNVLSLKGVYASPYGEELLREIDFSLRKGEILSVLGPNGSGKTSLLNLLCGAVPIESGEYKFAGKPFERWSTLERAQSQAVLPQNSPLSFPFTVEEVVLLGRSPHASGIKADMEVIRQAMDATDTTHLRSRLYTQLSGGERQRVQLARVFSQIWREEDSSRRVLLLDEPTSALDLNHQKRIMESVEILADGGCSIVMVLHDFNLVGRHSDQCLVLDNGTQWTQGKRTDVLHKGMFQKVFGVSAHVLEHPIDAVPVVIC